MDWAYTKEVGEVLVIVDAGTGWIEAFPCKDRSSDTVIRCLEVVFTRFGPADTIVSNNAKEFISDYLNRWIEVRGARKMELPPYFPRSNGSAERAVQTVKRFIRCWSTSQFHKDFGSYLRKVLFHHRISSTSRGTSPAELVFGRKLKIPVVSKFQQGQKIWYKPAPTSLATNAEFLMTKGNNTSWIMRSAEDDDS